jgi:peptide/nickel transport system substrate-binding protein
MEKEDEKEVKMRKILSRWKLVVVVLTLIMAVPLVSCAPQQSPTPSTSASPSPTATASPSPTPTAAVEKIIRQTQSWPLNIDPAVGSDYVASVCFANLYDTLVFPNPDGTVKPWLATDWQISDDGLTYTFNLRHGVKFHNGDELTAEDVVFSMQRMLTIGEGYGYLFTTTVQDVKALDTYKVQFTLKKTFGPFLSALVRLYILNKNQVMANIKKDGPYGDFGDYGKDWLLTHDAGSGPYMVKEVKLEEYIYAVKFPDYWAGFDPNAPDSFKQIGTTEAVTVRTLMSRGELEITDQWQTAEALDALKKLPGVEIAGLYEGSCFYVMMNTKKPPTDDIHFRKALAYCIDYDAIAKLFPGSKVLKGPVASVLPGWDPNCPQYKLDLDKAKQELQQSKYYGQLDQYPFELHWIAEVPDEEKVALMLQANAAKIGIKIDVVKVPWTTVVQNLSKVDTTPNGVTIFVAPHYAEAGSLLESRYHSKSCGTWEQGEWLQDPEIDKMIEDAISTINDQERFQKYQAIQEKIVDLCPSIFLFEQCTNQAYRADFIYFPAWEAVKSGGKNNPVMGYDFYFRDFRVYPEKKVGP